MEVRLRAFLSAARAGLVSDHIHAPSALPLGSGHCFDKTAGWLSEPVRLWREESVRTRTVRPTAVVSWRGQSPVCHRVGPLSIPGQALCDLWRTESHCDRFPSCTSCVPLSVSLYHFTILVHSSVTDSTYIQGVTGGTDQTSGGCSLC